MILEVKQLVKNFGGVQAVNDCSFGVESESITALIGPNGAGKSTVFDLITGVVKPDVGRILFQTKEINSWPIHKRAQLGLARTFQQVRLFANLTVRENLQLCLSQKDDHLWQSWWQTLEIDDQPLKKVLKEIKADLQLDILANSMSYGQQKLLSLARALLQPHQLLLLDEPVAGINPVLRDQLKMILLELKDKRESILLIEHDMDFVMSIADRVIVMDQGGVITSGSPAEVQKNPQVLTAYLGEQL